MSLPFSELGTPVTPDNGRGPVSFSTGSVKSEQTGPPAAVSQGLPPLTSAPFTRLSSQSGGLMRPAKVPVQRNHKLCYVVAAMSVHHLYLENITCICVFRRLLGNACAIFKITAASLICVHCIKTIYKGGNGNHFQDNGNIIFQKTYSHFQSGL
ncbi:hypothetical protein COCON_G00035770, partial [Conger conger]